MIKPLPMRAVNPKIFKAYDIRGIYPDDLDEEVVYRIGRAYPILLQQENPGQKLHLVMSRDMRLSSPALAEALKRGLIDAGADVVDIGLASAPAFYFAVAYWNYDGGLQITASHNPKDYNGLKIVRRGAGAVSGESGIKTIRDLVINNQFPSVAEKGSVTTKGKVIQEMVEKEREVWPVDLASIRPFKIVVDAANAMAGPDIEAMFAKLPCQLIKMNFSLDGSFPVHQPDPLVEENLIPLQQAVIAQGADLGIAPDGDGDRYFFVDNKGEIVRPEILRGLMAKLALRDYPGAIVAYDVRPGRITSEMIKEAGGVPLLTPVGHSLIKEAMVRAGAVFGGESSGHYFYKFPFGTFEAPVVLIFKLLAFLSASNKPLADVIAPYKKYFHSGEINCRVANPEAKMKALAQKYAAGKIFYLDGITIEYDDFWFNVRPSNTEPLLRLNLEAKTAALMEEKRDEVLGLMKD